MTNNIEKLYSMVNGIDDTKSIPKEAEEFAKKNGLVVIIGGSDDLMYCFGAESYLTSYCEHSYGWDGDLLTNIKDKQLEDEAKQLGLEIYWCGKILDKNENVIKQLPEYNRKTMGRFSYLVKEDIAFKNFTVYEDFKKYGADDVYCTGIIIELPKGFGKTNNKNVSNEN